MIGAFPWDPFPPGEPDPKGPDPVHAVAYRAAVTAADAYHAVRLALRRESGTLRVGNRFVPDGRYREVGFLAAGNAANSMALGALHALGDRLTQGFLAGPEPIPPELPFQGVTVPPGLPGTREAEEVVLAAHEIAAGLGAQDLFLVLLSPGALGALATPPPGLDPAGFRALLTDAFARGASGREIGLLARVLGRGAVGGRLPSLVPEADTTTLLVERGDGAAVLGGGPMRPIADADRAEVRAVVERIGLGGSWPAAAGKDAASTPPPGDRFPRPVVVASPSDALRAASDAVFEKGWSVRLGFLEMHEPPDAAARRLLERSEELLATERLGPESRTKGVATFAMASLGLPEGVDEGPALATFLGVARSQLRRREGSVGLFRTGGDIGTPLANPLPDGPLYPPGAVIGAPTDPEATVAPDRARGLRMRRGITDVGCLALVLYPKPESRGTPA
ncbi:MAG TPA: DUF4147 domain-containing protein [Thermoplasmata archaeon]|nr:DUF4147 domain-containing protein [Thermoplasmata archaeon]